MRRFILLMLYEAYIRKRYLGAFILILLGVASFLASAIIGTKLDSNGVLQEPFYLIISGYVLIFTGLMTAVIVKIVTYIKTRKYV